MQTSYIDDIRAALGAGPDGPSTREIAHALVAERDALRARVAELPAPPVVPEGWRVDYAHTPVLHDALGWTLFLVYEGEDIPDSPCAYINSDGWLCSIDGQQAVAPWGALAALEYAHHTDQRPPHAGDE